MAPTPRGPFVFVGLRFIRESINALFPVAVVGGDLISARLLAQFGIGMSLAIASVLVDIFVQVVCLLIFVLTGFSIVLDLAGSHRLSALPFIMLGIAVPAVAGFFFALNFGASDAVVGRLLAFGQRRQWSLFTHVADLGGRLGARGGGEARPRRVRLHRRRRGRGVDDACERRSVRTLADPPADADRQHRP